MLCRQYHLERLMVSVNSLHQFPADCPCLVGVKSEGKQQNDLRTQRDNPLCSGSRENFLKEEEIPYADIFLQQIMELAKDDKV